MVCFATSTLPRRLTPSRDHACQQPQWSLQLVVGAALAMSIAGFIAVVDSGGGQLLSNGPFTARPELNAQLESLFSVDFLFVMQILFHVLALVAFVVTGALIFVQKSHDWMKVLSSALLVLLGVSLFAPLNLARFSYPWLRQPIDLIGIAGPSPKFWFSLSGLALVLFAFLFPRRTFRPQVDPTTGDHARDRSGLLVPLPGLGSRLGQLARCAPGRSWPWHFPGRCGSSGRSLPEHLRLRVPAPNPARRALSRSRHDRAHCVVAANSDARRRAVRVGSRHPRLEALYELNLILFLGAVVLLLPVSLAVSVIRYRLWDFPVFVSRVLIYGSSLERRVDAWADEIADLVVGTTEVVDRRGPVKG